MPATHDTLPTPAESRPERGVKSFELRSDRETVFSVYDESGTRVLRAVIPIGLDREFFADLAERWLEHCDGQPDRTLRLIG